MHSGVCRQKRSETVMKKIQNKMQMTATAIIVIVFCSIFMSGAAGRMNAKDYPTNIQVEQYEQTDEPKKVDAVQSIQAVAATYEPQETIEAEPILTNEKQYVYYDVPLDDDFQEYIQDICDEYGFDCYDVVIAQIERESTFRENAISETDDYGYMQINSCNHGWLSEKLGITDFLDGEQNVLAGVYMLSDLYNRYGDMGLALMCYNCGEYGAQKLWEQGIYSTKYSRWILEKASELEVRR